MIPPIKLPSQKLLKECFRYERSTGKLFWKKRPLKHFVSEGMRRRWNGRYAGLEAFTQVTRWGHRRGAIYKKAYLAHRVVWKLVTGKEPPDVIDHRDRNGQNNRWRNLREATTSQNIINGIRSGVSQRSNGKWRERGTVGGKRFHIGDYSSQDEAVRVRRQVHRELHGEFAP